MGSRGKISLNQVMKLVKSYLDHIFAKSTLIRGSPFCSMVPRATLMNIRKRRENDLSVEEVAKDLQYFLKQLS